MNAATFYMQSLVMPPLLDKCLGIYPEMEEPIEILKAKWQEENARLIKQGEKVLKKRGKSEGWDYKARIEGEKNFLLEEFSEFDIAEQKERCAQFMAVMISES